MAGTPARAMLLDLGLLLGRVTLGVVGLFHGSQKLFSCFGGPGITGFAAFLEKLNVPMPKISAVMSGSAEFFGGLLILIGFLPRIAAVPFAFNMLVAFLVAHGGKFEAQKGGGEYPLTLALFALALVLTGPGRFSLDAILFRRKPAP